MQLYSLSGSPFGWKVQLALGHLGVDCPVTFLSSDRGDLRTPSFLAMNRHGKVPVLVDGALTLYESDVIVEFLDDAHQRRANGLWPSRPVAKALARRVSAEVSTYLVPAIRVLVTRWLGTATPPLDRETLDLTKRQIAGELAAHAGGLSGGYVAGGQPTAADYALYPLVALLRRLDQRQPGEDLFGLVPKTLQAWTRCIESLPFFEPTVPPHWRSTSAPTAGK